MSPREQFACTGGATRHVHGGADILEKQCDKSNEINNELSRALNVTLTFNSPESWVMLDDAIYGILHKQAKYHQKFV